MRSQEGILFSRCLGINDSGAMASQFSSPSPRSEVPGATEITDCLNVTTGEDGILKSVPGLSTVITHTAPVTAISAGKRFLYTDSVNTIEWDGSDSTVRFPLVSGPTVHTPIDCRVATATKNYRSNNSSLTMAEATVGVNPNPETSLRFAAMPLFSKAFIHNSKLYVVNSADRRFVQYSEDYHYDLWDLGDSHIGHTMAIVDAGAAQGTVLLTHSNGVTVYVGTGPHDFVKQFYPCLPIAGTLYSGLLTPTAGYGHIFMAKDGIYLVNAEGLVRITGDKLKNVGELNTSYSSATVESGKYLAYGNALCVDIDIDTRAVTKRATSGVVHAAQWNNAAYLAVGSTIVKHSGTSALATSVTLPFSTFGQDGSKAILELLFTGTIAGTATITATGNDGRGWSTTVVEPGTVYNHLIKTPKGFLGSHIQVKIETDTGAFRMEKLRAVFSESRRAR